VAGRDVEVARERREVLERWMSSVSVAREHEIGQELPAVEDGDPGTDVANGNDEVVGLVADTCDALSAGDVEPDAVLKASLHRGILRAGGNEKRPLSGEERLRRDTRRAVRRADGGDGDARQDESPARGSESGDRHPVRHAASLRSRSRDGHVTSSAARWPGWTSGSRLCREGSSS